MIRYIDAVRELVGGSIGGLSDGPLEQLKFCSGQTPPTEEAIHAKLSDLQADYDSKQYQRDRQREYPELPEQLDMLFHAIDAGALDKTSAFYTTLKAVKDKYPKG